MRALNPGLCVPLLGCLWLACAPEPPVPATEVLSIEAGRHQVELRVPLGWRHHEVDGAHRIGSERALVVFRFLGFANPDGFQQGARAARERWRIERPLESRALLHQLRLRGGFPSQQQDDAFHRAWGIVLQVTFEQKSGRQAVEAAYLEVVELLRFLPTLSLSEIANDALRELGENERRDVAEETALVVNDYPALRIDTWDRLSHSARRRHVFVLAEGSLFCLSTDFDNFSQVIEELEAMLASVQLTARREEAAARVPP